MCNSKANSKTKTVSCGLPTAPWIYVNDPLDNAAVASALNGLIPNGVLINKTTNKALKQVIDPNYKAVVVVLTTSYPEACTAATQAIANEYREAAITHGCNFASINVFYSNAHKTAAGWGTNHLEVGAGGLTAQEVAEKIYKWLCEH